MKTAIEAANEVIGQERNMKWAQIVQGAVMSTSWPVIPLQEMGVDYFPRFIQVLFGILSNRYNEAPTTDNYSMLQKAMFLRQELTNMSGMEMVTELRKIVVNPNF